MINETLLDDEKQIKKIDKDNMYKFIMHMPESCTEILKITENIQFSYKLGDFKCILICAMGGSAIGGNIVKDLLIEKISIPIIINRGYKIPAFVDKRTLMIVISYSGNTEEPLTAFENGVERKCKIIGISSNGKLLEYCERLGIEFIKIPPNIQPRAAIPYLFIAILIILQKIKLIENFAPDLEEAISILKKIRNTLSIKTPKKDNIAKKIALRIKGSLPIIYAPAGYSSLARRMKCQINENSKNPAYWDEFSELNHNEIVGWELKSDITNNCCIIMLRTQDEDEVIRNRIEITKKVILKGKVKEVFEVWSQGNSKLAKILSLIFIGDSISYYLAILNGVNPTPVKSISELKRRLKEKMNILNLIENKLFSD